MCYILKNIQLFSVIYFHTCGKHSEFSYQLNGYIFKYFIVVSALHISLGLYLTFDSRMQALIKILHSYLKKVA